MSEFKAGAAGETEAQYRQSQAYLFKQAVVGIADTGVLAGLGVAQTATASASIVVGKGAGVVQQSLTVGVSQVTSNADKTIDVLTASAMGALPRYDLVILNADTSAVEVVIGTPNASPTDPTVSANHTKLARIRNAANATTIPTSAIDDLRVFTTLNVPASPSWTAITPVYTNTLGESMSVGNGTISGRWRMSGSGAGQVCVFQFKLTRGSTTNVGTGGSWAIQLPTAAVDSTDTGVGLQVVGSARKPLALELASSNLLVMNDVAGNRIGPSNPGGTAAAQAGHVYQGSITYFLP